MSAYLNRPIRTQEQAYLDIQAARRLCGLPTDAVEEQLERLLKLQGQAVKS